MREFVRNSVPTLGPADSTSAAAPLAHIAARPRREPKPPPSPKDFVCNDVFASDPYVLPHHEASSGVPYPISHLVDYSKISSSHRAISSLYYFPS